MQYRLLTAAVVLLAGYIAFGDYIQDSVRSSPESFVSDVGREIGGAITGIASSFGNLVWG